jgi:hypothetical protein
MAVTVYGIPNCDQFAMVAHRVFVYIPLKYKVFSRV